MFGTCARESKIPTRTNRIEIGFVKVGLSRDEHPFVTELTQIYFSFGSLAYPSSIRMWSALSANFDTCNVYTLLTLQPYYNSKSLP